MKFSKKYFGSQISYSFNLQNFIFREAEEFFRPRRPVSSSAIPRDITRNSTPNLAAKYKR
jgi:hypothetical protein